MRLNSTWTRSCSTATPACGPWTSARASWRTSGARFGPNWRCSHWRSRTLAQLPGACAARTPLQPGHISGRGRGGRGPSPPRDRMPPSRSSHVAGGAGASARWDPAPVGPVLAPAGAPGQPLRSQAPPWMPRCGGDALGHTPPLRPVKRVAVGARWPPRRGSPPGDRHGPPRAPAAGSRAESTTGSTWAAGQQQGSVTAGAIRTPAGGGGGRQRAGEPTSPGAQKQVTCARLP